MSATLDYDIKKCMGLLCKDSRWNVLTVLILHANIRNRCYVSMDTIAEMATAGNVNKATRVKKWLAAHGAYELVPHDKRVGEECNLPQRQHVYQLTGVLNACADLACDCHQFLKVERHYLYYAKEVISEDNIKGDSAVEVISDDNFNQSKVIPVENINGDNLSTTNTSIKAVVVKPLPPEPQERPVIFKTYEENIGQLTPIVVDMLNDDIAEYSEEWVTDAIKEARISNGTKNISYKYIQAILARWGREGKGSKIVKLNPSIPLARPEARLHVVEEATLTPALTPEEQRAAVKAAKEQLLLARESEKGIA